MSTPMLLTSLARAACALILMLAACDGSTAADEPTDPTPEGSVDELGETLPPTDESDPEADPDGDPDPAPEVDPEVDLDPEVDPEPDSDPEVDPDPDPDPEVDPEPDPEVDPEPDPDPVPGGQNGPIPTFTRVTLFDDLPGAAWLEPVDVDADGYEELLLSTLSEGLDFLSVPPLANGGAYLLRRDGGTPAPDSGVGSWSAETAFDMSAGYGFPNRSTVVDVDNDGTEDWVIAGGFLAKPTGYILWMKGTETGGELSFGAPQEIPVPDSTRWYHEVHPVDLDGDGDLDLLTTNNDTTVKTFGGLDLGTSRLEWFENLGVPGQASFAVHPIADVGGALFEVYDLDEDGDEDVLLPQFFGGASLIWMENPGDPFGGWAEHLIDDVTGKGFSAEIVDLEGDGTPELLYGNHNHQASAAADEKVMGVYWWDVPSSDVIGGLDDWTATKNLLVEGFHVPTNTPEQDGAPGVVHAGDVDQDGDLDISVSGDGDEGIYLYVQQADLQFDEVVLDEGLTMSGDHLLMDVDVDGDLDFVWCVFGEAGLSGVSSHVYVYLQGDPIEPPDPVDPGDPEDPDDPVDPAGDPSEAGPWGVESTAAPLELTVYRPDGAGPYPVVILIDGFNLSSDQYASYGEHLASWGFVAVLVDTPGNVFVPTTDVALRDHLVDVLDWIESGPTELAGKADPSLVAVAGHSAGGKAAIYLAISDPRPAAVFAIDPVDAPPSFVPVDPAQYPSVAPELMGDLTVPLVLVGETTNAAPAGLNPVPCAPSDQNFQQYYAAATSPALQIEVVGASHFSFIDNPSCGLTCQACPAGSDDPAATRALTQGLMTALFLGELAGEGQWEAWLTGAEMAALESAGVVVSESKNGF